MQNRSISRFPSMLYTVEIYMLYYRENTLLILHWFFTNVCKDDDTDRCWHACENVSLKRSLLLNKSSRTISLHARSLSRLSDSTCAISFSNTRNTSFTFACALSPCMLARSLSLNHVECTDWSRVGAPSSCSLVKNSVLISDSFLKNASQLEVHIL